MVVELHQPNADKKPVGMHVIPATGRQFYWTGKVAIGLMHQAPKPAPTDGELIIQHLMGVK
jgi:hypothetical protein